MHTSSHPHLFSSIRLGDTVFRNRCFAAPVDYTYLSTRNYPLDETIAFYERKAMGGAATVNVGSAVPDSKRGCIGHAQIYGAVDRVNPLGQFVPAMPEAVIEETIEAYGDAAAFAKFCGFGLVTSTRRRAWLSPSPGTSEPGANVETRDRQPRC